MGCDIHPSVEVWRRDSALGVSGKWHYHQPKNLCRFYYEVDWNAVGTYAYGHPFVRDKDGNPVRSKYDDNCKYDLPDFFHERNYAWFSILADVRNDSPGSPEYIQPIDQPRGRAPGITARARNRLSDEHSETWVTLRELMDYDYSDVFEGDFLLRHTAAAEVINYMRNLIPPYGTADDVRMVMDFDS